jgi:DNA polymerase-3 subunit epsilon
MREVVLDTETTGLDPSSGHRVVEIGCVELVNHVPTDNTFHSYLNPERDMPEDAQRVHGLSTEFLRGQPLFGQVVDNFLSFLDDAKLVIHNAAFDMGFINAELERIGRPPIPASRAIDTVALARRKFPGAPANLDALCRRFSIDNSARTKHGALLDAELLAEVYLELRGGRQPGFALGAAKTPDPGQSGSRATVVRPARAHAPSPQEAEAHKAFVAKLDDPIWDT